MKICTKCGKTKPLDAFGKRAASPGGRRPACKECTAADAARYRAEHPTGAADWRKANAGKVRAYRQANRERDRDQQRQRYAANPEPRKAYERARYATNPEPRKASSARYQAEHPEKAIDRANRYRARKLGAQDGPVDVATVRASTDTCYLCGKLLAGDVDMDHVVPLILGGAHSAANMRPTHASCNRSKSDTPLQHLAWYTGPTDLGTYTLADIT